MRFPVGGAVSEDHGLHGLMIIGPIRVLQWRLLFYMFEVLSEPPNDLSTVAYDSGRYLENIAKSSFPSSLASFNPYRRSGNRPDNVRISHASPRAYEPHNPFRRSCYRQKRSGACLSLSHSLTLNRQSNGPVFAPVLTGSSAFRNSTHPSLMYLSFHSETNTKPHG